MTGTRLVISISCADIRSTWRLNSELRRSIGRRSRRTSSTASGAATTKNNRKPGARVAVTITAAIMLVVVDRPASKSWRVTCSMASTSRTSLVCKTPALWRV